MEQTPVSRLLCEALALMHVAMVEPKTRGLEIVQMCGHLHQYVHTLAGIDSDLAHALADVQAALRDIGEHLRFFDDYEAEADDEGDPW